MPTKLLSLLPTPKRLRWQFMLALSVPALLSLAGGITAVYGLHMSSDTTRQLAEERLTLLQQAQDLVQCALLIERESNRMLAADSLDTMQAGYLGILKKLDLLDSLVPHLCRESNNLAVLDLNQAGQLYRNTVNIVAQLRKNLLAGGFAPPESVRQQKTLAHFHGELQRQVVSLVDSAHDLPAHFTLDYQNMIRHLTAESARDQKWVALLLAGSIFLALLVSWYFLGRLVVARLQQISNCLRLGETDAGFPRVPVQGNDEIGDMARALEQFLEDRRRLARTRGDLQQNEELLRGIIDAAPVPIFGLDLDGNVHSVWNRAAERILGWSAREVMGRPLPTVSGEKVDEFRRFGEQIRNGRHIDGIEVRREKRDGTLIDYSIHASPLRDAEGCIVGSISVLVDITERKRTERALKLTQFSLDRSVDAVYWIDPDASFIYVNDSACEALGYSRSELLAMSVPDIDPVFSSENVQSLWEKIKEEKSLVFEVIHRRKDGSTFPVEIATNYNRFEDKEYSCSFARDITERKRVEEDLRKFSRAVEQSGSAIVITDTSGVIDYVNPAFCRISGYSPDEALGRNPRIMKSGEMPAEVYADLWHTIRQGDVWHGELLNRDKYGNLYWESATISPVRDTTGTITHYLAVKENITERKKMEAELLAAKEKAESATRAKSVFLANMSHEIRTPMNVIINMSRLIRETDLTPGQQEYADMVYDASEILLTLIEDILDFSKIEAGKIELESIDFDLKEMMAKVTNMLELKASEKGLLLKWQLNEGIPQFVKGDPNRLRQVILNLVNNAVKFTEKGEIILCVFLEHETDSQASLKFSVSDTGIGIPADRMEKLFKPFSQVDASTTRKYGGTGLGLAISSKIVEMMGGRMGVESEPGKGTIFNFTICLGKSEGILEPICDCPKDPSVSEAGLAGLRILLAEDNLLNQKMARIVLEKFGICVEIVSNGKEAIEAVRNRQYDLVLMDSQMPVMDGLEASGIIRKEKLRIPIVALTANATAEDRSRCLNAGMDDYISKPVNLEKLRAAIFRVLKKSPAVKSNQPQENSRNDITKVFDRKALLNNLGGDEEIMMMFLTDIVPRELDHIFRGLKTAMEQNDRLLREIKRHAHTIKGLAANCVAKRLQDAAYCMEQDIINHNVDRIPSLFKEVEDEKKRLLDAIALYG